MEDESSLHEIDYILTLIPNSYYKPLMSVQPTLPLLSLPSRNPSRGGCLSRSLDLSTMHSHRPPPTLAARFQTLGDASSRDSHARQVSLGSSDVGSPQMRGGGTLTVREVIDFMTKKHRNGIAGYELPKFDAKLDRCPTFTMSK